MSNGVIIFEGMKVGFLEGDFQISINESGELSSKAILSTSFNVLPIWIRIAKDNLQRAEIASKNISNQWQSSDGSQKKELLILELEASMQVFVACGVAFDALYDNLRPYANITKKDIEKWDKNTTGRGKIISEIINRVYNISNNVFKQMRQTIIELTKLRDSAVHPSSDLRNACNRLDIKEGVDIVFAMYNFKNSESCYNSTNNIIAYLYNKKCKDDKVNELMENIFKTLKELNVLEEAIRGQAPN